MRRLKEGLARTGGRFGSLASFEQQSWNGDTFNFSLRVLGQSALGHIEVREEQLLIALELPWLLARFAERVLPALRKETGHLLEKH